MLRKKFLRIASLALVLLMMISLLAACAKENTDDTPSPPSSDNTDPTGPTEYVDPLTLLPNEKFNNYEFKILTRGDTNNWTNYDFITKEENAGEPVNDAILDRNTKVEEKYGITIVNVPTEVGNIITYVRNSNKAGDNAYDAAMPCMNVGGTLAVSGDFLDLTLVPGLDLENSSWDQRANSDLSIGGKLYFTAGDFMMLPFDGTQLIVFNKNLLQAEGLESPYELVKNNKWTLDKFIEMTQGVTKDLNGDDKLDHNDQWGYLTEGQSPLALFSASGELLVTKDKDDLPQLVTTSDRTIAVVEKIIAFSTDWNNAIKADKLPSTWTQAIQIFVEGKILFRSSSLRHVKDLRKQEMQDDFGLLPLPKWDENQESYYHNVQTDNISCVGIPSGVQDQRRAGMILQAICVASTDTVRTAYYDINLLYKNTRDNDSIEMLDIIFSSRRYDLGQLYNWGNIGTLIRNLSENATLQFTSELERIGMSVEISMGSAVDKILALEH